MAKDPAFLFYPNDWLGGTMGMSFEEKGAYMELLMMQFNRGHMTSHMIGQTVGRLWDNIKDKFTQDENGLWYNRRLEDEKIKRQNYTQSRINNKEGKNQYSQKTGKNKEKNTQNKDHMRGHTTSHMENENENENRNKDVDKITFSDFENFRKNYPGTKRGYETELDNLQKKHKDWKKILPQLPALLSEQIRAKEYLRQNGQFVPQWKNLQTYINNRSWEEKINVNIKNGKNNGATVDEIAKAIERGIAAEY